MMFPKDKRIRLHGDKLHKLYDQVLKRDHCRCQECGVYTNLEIHHIKFRSQGGNDCKSNLITLCRMCHSLRHGIKIVC